MLPIQKIVPVLFIVGVSGALSTMPSTAQTPTQKMKDCLSIEDLTKERLDCFDAIVPPEPRPSAKKAHIFSDCRFFKEEDERLNCYDGFVSPRKQSSKITKSSTPPKTTPPPKQ